MTTLRFDVRVVPPTEPAAHQAMEATRLLEGGDRTGAERLYREAAAMPVAQGSGWINLAALGIALGDAQGARAHALRALQWDRGNADAWANFGVASWMLGQRRDAAQATHRALELAPGMEVAALNYAKMLRTVDRGPQAREMLQKAIRANPGGWRLHLALAENVRLLGDADATRRHALAALSLLRPRLAQVIQAGSGPVPRDADGDAAASARVQQALFAAHDALSAAGLPFHLIGGTLLAIHRDGHPFPHDKDIDLGLPWDCDRDAVAAAFAQGFRPVLPPGDARERAAREWVMGFIHEDSGIGVDLMFARERDGMVRFELGWPDQLACEFPAYPLQGLHWAGREWQVPSPPEHYLDALYGPDWNGGPTIRGFDRRWFDTQVSNPSRTADSLPRAVNLALLRLLRAVQAGQGEQARALCLQILARERLPEVEAALSSLQAAAAA